MADGQYKFGIGLDTRQLRVNIQEAKKMFEGLSLAASKMGKGIDDSFVQPIVSASSPLANIPKQVGAATQSFNGLNMATQQLVRELPAASMGLNTLFLAMSNNLPIFADQVKQLRENGESVGDIFKEFGKSLFSWQTALVVGVTLLASYGKEIGNFITSLFKGKEAIDATKKAQEGLNKAIKENSLGIGDSFVKLRQLGREYRLLGDNINARKQFILDNKSAFDDLGVAINSVVDADRLLIERTPDFVQAMMLRAQASAAKRLAEEKYEEFFRKRQEYIDERDAGVSAGDRFNAYASGLDQSAATGKTAGKIQSAEELYQNRINILKNEAIEVKNAADAYFELSAAKNLEADTTLRNAGISEATTAAIKTEGKTLQELHDAIFGSETEQTADTNRAFEKMRKDLADSRAKSIEDLEQYYIDYGSFQERLLATTQRYKRLIAEAENEGQRLSLEAERDAILAQFEVESSAWAKELVGKTTEQLNTMLDELEKTLAEKEQAFQALDNSRGDDAKTLRDKINELNAQIAILKERLGEADDAVANDNWADAIQVFQSVAKSAAEAAQSIAEFDENIGFALNGIAQLASLSVDAIGALQGVKKAFDKTGEAASAMEKASAILAVISVAIKAVSAIFNVMKDNEEATRNATLAAYEYAQALERIRNEELRGSFSTIFGKDEYGEILALLDKSKAQLQEIEKQRRELAKTTENAVYNLGRSGSTWANFGGLRNTMNEGYNYDEALVADMRSGWQKFWGSGNDNIKYTSLDEFYEDGKLNVDKLKAYYNNYKEYLTEEQADLVKSLIDTGELYEENMQAISDYMSGIFGELGDDITNSIVDAFANGTDAAEAFRDSVSDIMRNFAADMVENMHIAPLLEQAQKDVEAIWADDTLSHEQKLAAIAARMAELGRELNDTQDDVNTSLDLIDKAGKGQGFDIFDGADRKGSTKSGIQATQDSIDELSGRATAIQSHTYALANGQKQLIKDSASILKKLTSIEVNTRELHAMRKDMASMRSDINTIATRGIKAL